MDAAASGLSTRTVQRRAVLAACTALVVNVSCDDRRKKPIRLVDDTTNPDDVDPLTTAFRAIAARLTLSDAHVVAGFLEEVLATLTLAAPPRLPAEVR